MAAEWTKLWSVRSTAWTLVATGVAVIGLCALGTGTVSRSEIIDDPTRRSLIGIFLGQLIFGVLGVLVMSAEYGTGTIRATLSAVPRRPVVLSAKILVFGTVAVVASEVFAFTRVRHRPGHLVDQERRRAVDGHRTARPPARGEDPPQPPGRALLERLRVLGAAGRPASRGRRRSLPGRARTAGVGTGHHHPAHRRRHFRLCRGGARPAPHRPGLPTSISNAVARYLPANIGLVMFSTNGSPDRIGPAFSPWTGFALLVLYTVVILGIGCWVLVRRDA